MEWTESQISAHSLCDPVPHLISLKLISSCCSSSVCLTGPVTLRPVPSLFAPSPFELHHYSCAFLGTCRIPLEAGDRRRCNGLITSRCFSESNCIFEVTVLRPSHFLFPQTVQGTLWLFQIDAGWRNANGQDGLCRRSQRRECDGESQFPVKLAWLFL